MVGYIEIHDRIIYCDGFVEAYHHSYLQNMVCVFTRHILIPNYSF